MPFVGRWGGRGEREEVEGRKGIGGWGFGGGGGKGEGRRGVILGFHGGGGREQGDMGEGIWGRRKGAAEGRGGEGEGWGEVGSGGGGVEETEICASALVRGTTTSVGNLSL